MGDRHIILQKYDLLRKASELNSYNSTVAGLLGEIYSHCLKHLGDLKTIPLKSLVPNKSYFAFSNGTKISRAVNVSLYQPELGTWETLCNAIASKKVATISNADLSKVLYSVAISFCSAIDLLQKDDRQTPGTYFGKFIAFFFASQLQVQPVNFIRLMDYDGATTTNLETDYVFDLGVGRQKFHMPVKTSSRERAIMFWAHQKLIDGAYGIERFMGTPVLLAETKTDYKKKEVVEICLPEQWKVYQLYIARLKRVYYLDMPQAYADLNKAFPPITVKPFAEFFSEWNELAPL